MEEVSLLGGESKGVLWCLSVCLSCSDAQGDSPAI